MVFISNMDYRLLKRLAVPAYLLSLILSSLVLVIGKEYNGSKRWLALGPLSFQPSEFAKIAVILFLAWLVERGKIESKLSVLKGNIERITLEGGSAHSYTTWLERYNAINCGLQAVRDAYMPQGKRKEQYLAIYKDILLKNTEVCEYILYLRKLKEVKNNSGSAPAPHRANITTICRSAHGRWKVAMAVGGGIGE